MTTTKFFSQFIWLESIAYWHNQKHFFQSCFLLARTPALYMVNVRQNSIGYRIPDDGIRIQHISFARQRMLNGITRPKTQKSSLMEETSSSQIVLSTLELLILKSFLDCQCIKKLRNWRRFPFTRFHLRGTIVVYDCSTRCTQLSCNSNITSE